MSYSQEKFDILFGKDLAEKLNEIHITDGNILMYEIQQQYYLKDFHGISIDAIVGSETLDYLNKREKLKDVIKRNKIQFVVCHQSAIRLQSLDGSELQKLYRAGMTLDIGDTVTIDGVTYKKILFNNAQRQQISLTSGDYIPTDDLYVYGPNELWTGGTLFWQTVFAVEDIN